MSAEYPENQTELPLDEEESMLQLRLAEIAEIKKANAIKARADALVPVLAAIKEHGFTAAELGFKKSALAAAEKKAPEVVGDDGRKKVAPLYRDPESGATWTGRGKTPGWMQRKIAAGKIRDDFLIDKPTAPPESGQILQGPETAGLDVVASPGLLGDLPKIDEPTAGCINDPQHNDETGYVYRTGSKAADGADPFTTA